MTAPGGTDDRDREETTALQSVLDALDDRDCREIIRTLEEPMTAREIATRRELPRSTTYRKLDLLTEAGLVVEETTLEPGEGHVSQFRLAVEEVTVTFDEDREFDVNVVERERDPEDRLAELWQTVGEQL